MIRLFRQYLSLRIIIYTIGERILIFLVLFIGSRRILHAFIISHRILADKALIVGTGELAQNIIKEINEGLSVKAIITGWTQIIHPYGSTEEALKK